MSKRMSIYCIERMRGLGLALDEDEDGLVIFGVGGGGSGLGSWFRVSLSRIEVDKFLATIEFEIARSLAIWNLNC